MSDVIGELTANVHLRARVFYRGQHCGRWQLDVPGTGRVMLHLVTHGRCLIQASGQPEPVALAAGDSVVFTRSGDHKIRPCDDEPGAVEDECVIAFELGLRAGTTGLFCAHIEFDPNIENPLIEALPDCVVVRAQSHPHHDWFAHLLALLLAESTAEIPASAVVTERLVDALFIHVLRSYLSESPKSTGVFAAYQDRALRAVLTAIHSEPQRPWGVIDLAQIACLSRSAFIERFTRVLGTSPIAYLQQQRLALAYRRLREGQERVLEIALACGYESEASLSKAFKRRFGFPPSILRRAWVRKGRGVADD